MRAGLYARVSSEEQAEGYSLEAQLEAMRRFCQDRGWTVAVEWVEPGYTATTDRRPVFDTVLAACEAGQVDVLITHKLDRAFRNLLDQLQRLAQLEAWNVGYVSVVENIDYSTPHGKLFLSQLGALNEYYSRNLAQEIKKGKEGRARAGLPGGNMAPHGYVRVEGRHIVDPETAPAVVKAFELYATGEMSYQDVADALNRAGHPPSGWKADRWLATSVRYVLVNRHYLGEIRHRREWLPGQHEAIISQELFDQVQETRRQRRHSSGNWGGGRRSDTPYLLHRVVFCHECEQVMYADPGKWGLYWRDSARFRGIDCPVAGRGVKMERLDVHVAELVRRLRLPDDWRERLAEIAEHREEQENLEGKRNYLRGRLRRLREVYIDGDLDRADYERRRAKLQAQLDALQVPEVNEIEEAGETLETLADAWDGAPVRLQRSMLRCIFEGIYVDVLAAKVVFVKPWPPFWPLFRMDGLEEREKGVFYVEKEA